MRPLNTWVDYEPRMRQEASATTTPFFFWYQKINQLSGSCLGPDAQRRHQTTLKSDCDATVHLDFFASELCLRGDAPIAQPHLSESGDVLCWNGEVWSIPLSEFNCALLISIFREDLRRAGRMFLSFCPSQSQLVIASQLKVRPEENDGIKLSAAMGGLDDASDIVQLLGIIEGP